MCQYFNINPMYKWLIVVLENWEIIMKKLLILLAIFLLPQLAIADESTVSDAKITKVEFYGAQFTVYLDKPHASPGCGHEQSFAVDSATKVGSAHMSVLIAAWVAGKTITAKITDDNCFGDRPTLIYWSAK